MTIEQGTVLFDAKNGNKGVIIKVDKVAKTAIIEMEDGSTKSQCFTTYKDKRRWVGAEDQYVVEVMQQKKDLGIECPPINPEDVTIEEITCTTPELVPIPGVEKLAELKKEYPGKKPKTPCEGVGCDLKDLTVDVASSMGAEICIASSGKFISFKVNGKMFAAIFSFSKKSMTLGTRSAAVSGVHLTPSSVMNHMMDFRFTFDSLSDTNEKLITEILRASMDYQLSKNNK